MRRFLLDIILGVGIISLIISIVLLLGPYRIQHSAKAWLIPPHKHILFCGASQIALGINDSLMVSGVNVAKQSERYLYTYLKLQRMLDCNPQIDTIFLHFSPTDLWKDADDKYFIKNEQVEFVPLFWTLFGEDELKYFAAIANDLSAIVWHRLFNPFNWKIKSYQHRLGGYISKKIDTDLKMPQKVVSELHCGNTINHRYCKKIIDMCAERGVKLYFIFMPVWNHHLAYDIDDYYSVYNQKFCDVELLDYSKFDMDCSERYDAHHLNSKGAERFTKHIMEEFNIR